MSATLTLEGENTVWGSHDYNNLGSVQPGIFIAENKTLTIEGNGQLTAEGYYGAGIGGGGGLDLSKYEYYNDEGKELRYYKDYEVNCGNIVINSGNITARSINTTFDLASGGKGGAGIGVGYASKCGDITINGGTVNATGGLFACGIGSARRAKCGNITINGGTVTAQGGTNASGIGSGYADKYYVYEETNSNGIWEWYVDSDSVETNCGDITIGTDVESVTATKGSPAEEFKDGNEVPFSIGRSCGTNGTHNAKKAIASAKPDGRCGTITIGGVVTGEISESPYTYPPTTTP